MNQTDYATLHLKAKAREISSTVVMVGDPGRAKDFAMKYLDNPKLVCNIREVNLWTGRLQGKKISVMAHGMGASSIGIYAHELFEFFGVQRIIRLGTCGLYTTKIDLGGIIIGTEYFTLSNFGDAYKAGREDGIKASQSLVDVFEETMKEEGTQYEKGGVYTSIWFYAPELEGGGVVPGSHIERRINNGEIVAKEMEGYVLQAIANYYNKEAVTILTGINSMTMKIFNDIDTRVNNDEMLDIAAKVLVKIA